MTILFWIALALALPLQAPVPGGVTVKGRIVPPGSPAISATGRVTMTGGVRPVESAVGADGSFEFLKVGPGVYQLTATPGTRSQPVSIVVSDKNISDIELANPKTVEVTGSIVVQNGGLRPLVNLTFSPYQGGPGPGTITINPVNGVFRASLAEGDYRVAWSGTLPAGYFVQSIESGSVDLLSKPLTIMGTAAPPITITLGVSSPPPWVKVSGRVTGLPRTPGVASRVRLGGGPAPVGNLEAPIEADGTFVFPMVLSGRYNAIIFPSPAGMVPPLLTFNVARNDVDNLEFVIPVTRCVPGRAVVEGDGPIPKMLIFSLDASGNSSGASTVPLADGRFSILLPEGERRMTLATGSLPSGYTPKSFTYGSVDLLRDSLRLSSTASLLLTLTAAPGSWANVSGRVTGIDPTARAYRVRVSDGSGNFSTVVVPPNGSFSFGKLLRGNYTIGLESFGGIPVSKPLFVTGQDITAFELAAPPQKEVSGHITLEGGGQQSFSFSLVVRGNVAGAVNLPVSSGRDGNFKVPLPEGESQVSVSGVPSGAIKSLHYGDVDLLKEPLRVSRTDTAELRVTLASGTTGGVLGGILTDANNGSNACGILFPAGAR